MTPHSVKEYYRNVIRRPGGSTATHGSTLRGWWAGRERPAMAELAEAVGKAEARPVAVLKESRINRSFRAELFGQDLLVKRYLLADAGRRLGYRFRASRGRRDWAAAMTLTHAGLPVPEPMGFLEVTRRGLPEVCYAFSAFLPQTRTARSWIRPHLHRYDAEFRAQVRREIEQLLMNLYRLHIYHADTKAGNILVASPEDPGQRTWYWIDLDCVRFGRPPTRRRVLRNLIQLNGSLGSKLPDEDRLAFLADLADTFPWLAAPEIPERIRHETRRRLQRELERTCGP